MTEYTAIEVIKYFKDTYGIQKSRKRKYIDPRNYVIALLYYKFKYIEEELADLFLIDRTSINHAKDKPYSLIASKNKQFLEYCEQLIQKFPYIPPYNDRDLVPKRMYIVDVVLTKEDYEVLSIYASAKDQYVKNAARDIIVEKLNKINKYGKNGRTVHPDNGS